MAEKTLNTRILLKYDSYANWTTNNPVLKKGEVAIATIAADYATQNGTQEVNSVAAPQVLIKVGDGTSTYTQLPFVSAKAADVYSWAKAEKKPTYEAKEITGIDAYIADYVEEQMGISVDTDTQYQIVKGDNDYTYKLQSKGKTDSAWADVANSVITIPQDDTDTQYKIEKGANDYTYVLKSKGLKDTTWTDVSTFTVPSDDTNTQYSFSLSGYTLTIKKKDIGDTGFVDYTTIDLTTAFNAKADKVTGATAGNFAGLDANGNLTDSGAKAADFATSAQGTKADSALQKADIDTGTTNGTIKVKGTDVAVKGLGSAAYTDADTYETKNNASAKYDELAEADAEIGRQIENINGDIGELSEVALTADELESVKKWVEFDAEGNVPVDEGTFNVLNSKVTTLVGSDTGKSVREIANAELAAQLIPANADEALNTLQEIAAWIQAHPEDAATMNAAITAIQKQLAGIDAGDGTVKKYVDDAIAALKIGDYAKAADLTALAGRVATAEEQIEEIKDAIDVLEAGEDTVGSVDYKVATAIGDAMGDLAAIASTGNVNDLVQTTGDVLIFDCGTSVI